MRLIQPTTSLLMALLVVVALGLGCATKQHQITSYEGCVSQCSAELERCISNCNTWKVRVDQKDEKFIQCINKCNEEKAKCDQLCSKWKGPSSEPMPQ
jgi:hypothetical protein